MYKKRFRITNRHDIELHASIRKKEEGLYTALNFIIADNCKNIFSKKKRKNVDFVIIHKTDYDTVWDFIKKLKKIIAELKNFYLFLKEDHDIFYSHKVWLNKNSSPSTGSLVCYYGLTPHASREEKVRTLFIEFGDCQRKIRIYYPLVKKKDKWIVKENVFRDLVKMIKHLETFVTLLENIYGE